MKSLALAVLVGLAVSIARAQEAAPARAPDTQKKLDQLAKRIQDRKSELDRKILERKLAQGETAIRAAEAEVTKAKGALANTISSPVDLILEWLYTPIALANAPAPPRSLVARGLLSAIEQKQVNKQVEAPGGTPGSTSIASKGPAPGLIGLAVENGALQQTVSGTVITIRGNPAGLLTALAKKDLVKTADAFASDPGLRFVKRFSFSGTFDISHGAQKNVFTARQDQLAGYSARFDVYNGRDPRDPKYDQEWRSLLEGSQPLGLATGELTFTLRSNTQVLAWQQAAVADLEASSAADVPEKLIHQLDLLKSVLDHIPEVKARVQTAGALLESYAAARSQLIDRIARSAVLTLEYNNIRQFAGADQTGPKPPDLSSLKLVYTRRFVGDSEFTGNVSSTLFNSRPVVNGSRVGRLRDVQGVMQFDIPLPEIQNLGKGVLTFAGLVLRLQEEPLGQKVQVNGKDVSAKGTIGVAQVKVAFPVTEGLKIPIAISYASRTELLPDKSEVRGNIGLTFDLDKLFARK